MRKIKILQVNPTTTVPGSIEVLGDFTPVFHGKFYRNSAGLTQPGYTTPAPAGYTQLVATSFDIIENTKYAGRYTVYSQVDNTDLASSQFASGKTTIRVVDVIAPLGSGEASTLASDGYITNISTYLIETGSADIVIPQGVMLENYPIDLPGRNISGWGESYVQNFVDLVSHWAHDTTPPANPFIGQTHYNKTDKQYRSWDGTAWDLVNKASFGTTYKHTQSTNATTWTVDHNLGLASPFIAFVQIFVDRGAGPKQILPSDMTFVSANQLTVTFTNAEKGWVLVRP